MNQKRKAELQRKLAMTSVPKPPDGLADRIKADIPHDLAWTNRQRRFFPSPALSLRVAASILVLIASAYVVLHLLTRYDVEMPNVYRQKSVAETAAPQVPPAELTISLAEQPKRAVAAPAQPAQTRVTQSARRDELKPQAPAPAGFAPEVAAKDKQEQVASNAAREQDVAASGALTVVAAAPALPPSAAAAPAPPAQEMAGAVARKANGAPSPAFVKSARASDLSFAPPREVFGLSIDPSAFDRVKQTIDRGQRPDPESVDVAGLVNYFAGSAKPPKREVRLDVEGSRAPIEASSALIRFTIETPHADIPPGASLPPVATDADLTITLNSDAVISHRLLGAESLKAQSMLVKNTSVTGMVEIELSSTVRPMTTVATLRLRYRSASDGKWHTIPRIVRASEVMRSWDSASRRHKLATLGGVWSESLTGGRTTREVAQQAEKLATEAPDDARARELAAAASAFSRLQSSGPTGSGR